MATEEETEEGGEQEEGGKKSYWWLTLSLLAVFLAAGGYIAVKAMRQSAQKLAGVENAAPLSADSGVNGGDLVRGKTDNVFASEEPGPVAKVSGSALNDKLKPGWVKEMVAENEAKTSGAGARSASVQDGADGGGAQGGYASAGGVQGGGQNGNAMASRLQSKGSFGSRAGASASKTGAPSAVEGFQTSGAAVGRAEIQKETRAAAPKKGAGGGVMDALKGAFKASFYGARVASQDAAKGWIAKSFDASPEAETSIQYDPLMKSKLDVVNPNSIPKFLRDQDVSAAEAKTLPASKVGDPSMDKEGTKEALAEDKDYQKKKAANDLAKSVINPLFAGLGDLGGGSDVSTEATDPTSPDSKSRGVDPNGDPSLGSVDEYGNTTLAGSDGMSYIFDPDGKLLGCDNGSMCIMPGGDGCSAGLSLI
jgi:hypothetical protein